MEIRGATPEQFDALTTLIRAQSYPLYGFVAPAAQYEDWILHTASEQAFQDRMQHGHLLVAMQAEQLQGTVNLNYQPGTASIKQGADVALGGLYIAERGVGLGSQLLQTALQLAKADGKHVCMASVAQDNRSAKSFYVKHGFRHVGEHPGANMFSIVFDEMIIDL